MGLTVQEWQAIGTWVAGLATVAAVITSLWLAMHQNRIKLAVSVSHWLLIRTGSSKSSEYCGIHVTNIGYRPARIVSVTWRAGARWTTRGPRPRRNLYQHFGDPLSAKVPATLQEGEEAKFMIPLHWDDGSGDWLTRFPETVVGEDSPRMLDTLKVAVHTSVGQTFTAKPDADLGMKLKESYDASADGAGQDT